MKKILSPVLVTLIALYFLNQSTHEPYTSILSNVNLIIHESGHMIFYFFGRLIMFIGGSLMQILVPVIFVTYFIFKNKIYSVSFMLMWLGDNLLNVATYAGDAIKMQLPLLGDVGTEFHDWNNILSIMHLLKYTNIISGIIHYSGLIIIASSILFSWIYFFQTQKDREFNSGQ